MWIKLSLLSFIYLGSTRSFMLFCAIESLHSGPLCGAKKTEIPTTKNCSKLQHLWNFFSRCQTSKRTEKHKTPCWPNYTYHNMIWEAPFCWNSSQRCAGMVPWYLLSCYTCYIIITITEKRIRLPTITEVLFRKGIPILSSLIPYFIFTWVEVDYV